MSKINKTKGLRPKNHVSDDTSAETIDRTLSYIDGKPEAYAQLLLSLRWSASNQPAYESSLESMCCPPGSLISGMLRVWHQGTSIPLGMPYWIILGYASGFLAARGVRVLLPDASSLQPKIWTTLLAPAGCGKTWTEAQVAKVFGADANLELSEAVSTAAFVAALARKTQGVWTRDEWGQFMRQLEMPSSPLAGVRDVLLRVHEGQTVGRERVRGESVTVENPCMSILGITVDSTYEEIVSVESLLDGFCSRFSTCYARPDPHRPWQDCPWWTLSPEDADKWPAQWEGIAKGIHDQYTVTPEAFAYFYGIYRRESRRIGDDVPEAFFRRVFSRWHVLALLLHVLNGNPSDELDVASYEVAFRALDWSLRDGGYLLQRVTGGAFRRMVDDAVKWRQAHPGTPLIRRNVISGVRSVSDARSADFVLRLLAEDNALGARPLARAATD